MKFGGLRDPSGRWLGNDGRPATVRTSLAYTLRRLGVDHVDVYRPARVDPAVPIEETVGANLERNLALVEALRGVAGERGASVAQVAIAWVAGRGEDIVPLIGAGQRYAPDQMAHLDSERR